MGLKTIDIPILCHQPKEELHKCLKPTIFGYQILLCSRCFGLYTGFIFTILFLLENIVKLSNITELILLAILPSIAFADWTATKLLKQPSNNTQRTLTGFCLGIAGGIIALHTLKWNLTAEQAAIPLLFGAIYLIVKQLEKNKAG